MGVSGLALIVAGASGRVSAAIYAGGVALCLFIALLAFLSQVFALLPADRR
jgi:hypothetical protein